MRFLQITGFKSYEVSTDVNCKIILIDCPQR